VPPGDPEALAAAITSLLADPARRRQLSAAARTFAEQHDADATSRRMTELYESLPRR
jgi:phosphatidylinositol alpha-mannosyltransferase